MGLVIYLATSKYGNIRLGEGKPEYSTLSWLFMFICAGLGSSTLYWGVAEWAYYYQTPGLNIAPRSQQALEFSVPGNDSNLLIVFYVQIMPDDFVMQLHRF
ncbi:BCCT-family transporter [Escherichia coli]|nr:BCCT-family transporter [Escherichia coli]